MPKYGSSSVNRLSVLPPPMRHGPPQWVVVTAEANAGEGVWGGERGERKAGEGMHLGTDRDRIRQTNAHTPVHNPRYTDKHITNTPAKSNSREITYYLNERGPHVYIIR